MLKKKKPEPATISLNFPNGAKAQPNSFNDLSVGDTVTITVIGKIKSISMCDYSDGYGDKDLRLHISKCVIGKHGDSSVSYSTN